MMTNANDVKIDFNKISKSDLRAWNAGRSQLRDDLGINDETTFSDPVMDQVDKYDVENLHAKVITEWPWGHVTYDIYNTLGIATQREVDALVSDALTEILEKK